MGFQEICEDVVGDTEGALGCLLIDLRTGLVLASAQRPGAALDDADVKTILHSSADMFRGKLVDQFVRSLPTNRGSSAGFVREVQITTRYTHQFMAATPGWEDGITILITERTLSLGIGWMAVHQAQERFAEIHRGTGQDSRRPVQDARSHAPEQSSMPVPPMMSQPVHAQMPPQPQSAPAPSFGEVPAAKSVPNPLLTPDQDTTTADSEASAAELDDRLEPDQPVVSGARARMFRARQSKKKNR